MVCHEIWRRHILGLPIQHRPRVLGKHSKRQSRFLQYEPVARSLHTCRTGAAEASKRVRATTKPATMRLFYCVGEFSLIQPQSAAAPRPRIIRGVLFMTKTARAIPASAWAPTQHFVIERETKFDFARKASEGTSKSNKSSVLLSSRNIRLMATSIESSASVAERITTARSLSP